MNVVDSTEHMANGGVKDDEYLAKKFIPVMHKIDPQCKLFGMVAFDGSFIEGGSVNCCKVSTSHCNSRNRACMLSLLGKGIQRAQTSASEDIHCHSKVFHFYSDLFRLKLRFHFDLRV